VREGDYKLKNVFIRKGAYASLFLGGVGSVKKKKKIPKAIDLTIRIFLAQARPKGEGEPISARKAAGIPRRKNPLPPPSPKKNKQK
jgi:hypothetical protein